MAQSDSNDEAPPPPARDSATGVLAVAVDRRVGFAGAAADAGAGSYFSFAWLWIGVSFWHVLAVLALDWRFILRAQLPFWCWCFRFSGAVAMLALALDRRFALRALLPRWCWCWIGVLFCRRWCRAGAIAGSGSLWIGVSFCGCCCRAGARPGMTPCHAQNDIMSWEDDIMSCQERHHVMPETTSCHARE